MVFAAVVWITPQLGHNGQFSTYFYVGIVLVFMVQQVGVGADVHQYCSEQYYDSGTISIHIIEVTLCPRCQFFTLFTYVCTYIRIMCVLELAHL